MNLRNLDSTLIFFSCFDFCSVYVLVSMFHRHTAEHFLQLADSQVKTLLAWSWRILCTVESLDLAMLDDHPSRAPLWAAWDSQAGRGKGTSSSASPPEVRVGGSSALWARTPSPLLLGSAPALPARSPWSSGLEHLHQSLLARTNCQLFSPSSQLTEWLPLVTQVLETCSGFPLHLVIPVLTP